MSPDTLDRVDIAAVLVTQVIAGNQGILVRVDTVEIPDSQELVLLDILVRVATVETPDSLDTVDNQGILVEVATAVLVHLVILEEAGIAENLVTRVKLELQDILEKVHPDTQGRVGIVEGLGTLELPGTLVLVHRGIVDKVDTREAQGTLENLAIAERQDIVESLDTQDMMGSQAIPEPQAIVGIADIAVNLVTADSLVIAEALGTAGRADTQDKLVRVDILVLVTGIQRRPPQVLRLGTTRNR